MKVEGASLMASPKAGPAISRLAEAANLVLTACMTGYCYQIRRVSSGARAKFLFFTMKLNRERQL